MALLMCSLSLLLLSVTFLGAFGQLTPIKKGIFDSISEKRLGWSSSPQKAWVETKMRLGQDSSHPVYQGCDSTFKNQPKTLWTKWFPRKDANELLMNLQFAQDDRTPVTVRILESDEPLTSLSSGQRRNEVVAASAFIQKKTLNLKDVEKHLYNAQDLYLGKISKKGFHLGFYYSGSCMFISFVQLFYMKCPGFTSNQASFGETSAGSGLIRGQCVDGAEEISVPMMACQSNGSWGALQGSCVCKAGYQTNGNICKACALGSYKPLSGDGECRSCPANSRTRSEGAAECDCEEGYGRLQNDPLHLGCTRPPSAPLNLTIHHLNNTALVVTWAAPADLGGREEVMYDVECRQNTGQAHNPWVQCGSSTFILPRSTDLTQTRANISGLHTYVNYQISVRAHNRMSTKDTTGSVQSITVWKRPVIISPAPVPTAHSHMKEKQKTLRPAMIAGVLCGVLLLLALIPAVFCFLRRGYSKLSFSGDHDVELSPLQTSTTTYRRPEEPETPSLHQTTIQVLDSVSDRLLCGIRDVLVDRSSLTLGKELGKGEFGAVYEGVFSQNGEHMKVAVKTMRVGIYSQDDLKSFLKEAEIMQHFDHDNVVKLLGVTLEREEDSSIPIPLVILPFLKHGDLRRFLIATRYGDIPMFVPHQSLLRFMVDIATGMEYLSSKGFLHRDLAARNCMLGDDLRVRVADFGLSKQIFSSDYYRQQVAIRMPIKWMAIESLSESIYTSKSDVWSFGVTMWEIVSRGKTPYPGISNHELLDMLNRGHRLKQGESNDKLYEVMLSCWQREPSQRPCFTELAQRLKALLSELPPMEASMEAHYINQGLEAASANQSSAAVSEHEGAVGNFYLSSPVSSIVYSKQYEETKAKEEEEEEEEGYLLCNKMGK